MRPKGRCGTCGRTDVTLVAQYMAPMPKLVNHARPEGGRCPGSFGAPAQ